MILKDAVVEYVLDGSQVWAVRTIDQYRWHLDRWRDWLAGHGVVALSDVSRRLLREWSVGIRLTWSPATCRTAVIAVRGFLRWCEAEGFVSGGLSAVLRVRSVPKRVQRTVTPGEVSRVLAVCRPVSGMTAVEAEATGLRNVALVSLLYDSLLRAAELCALGVGSVDVVTRRVLVVGKGGGERLVPFSAATGQRLHAWIEERDRWARCSALFVSIRGSTPGSGITPSGLRVIIRKLGQRAGVAGLSPHAFRRGGATAALVNGASTRFVQGVGGWSSVSMVETYTQALQTTTEMYDRFAPMSGVDS